MTIVSTSALPEAALAGLPAGIRVLHASGEEALLREVPAADAIIGGFGGNAGGLFERILGAAKRVRWIHTSSAGVDPLLCPDLLHRDIVLTCGKGHAVGSLLAEHAMALLLALTRGIAPCARMKTWGRSSPAGRGVTELRGKTMGIVGLGGVGVALAARARAFEMNVIALRRSQNHPPPPGVVLIPPGRLDDLLAQADVVVITVPLTRETKGMFDREALGRTKPGTLLVNVGRGEVVDTSALIEALRNGRLGGAGLDVVEQEPLPDDSPLWEMENVIITPHIAGNSPNRSGRNLEIVLENVRRFVAGQPLLCTVDKSAGY